MLRPDVNDEEQCVATLTKTLNISYLKACYVIITHTLLMMIIYYNLCLIPRNIC